MCDKPINSMDPSQTACKPHHCDTADRTLGVISFQELNSPEYRNLCFEFLGFLPCRFQSILSNEVPNHSGPIFQHHKWLQFSHTFPMNQRSLFPTCLWFWGFFSISDLWVCAEASCFPDTPMAVPYWLQPTHTALTEIQHSFPPTPTVQDNATIWMLQVWTDS